MAQTRRRGSIGSIGSGSLYLHDGYSPNLRVRSPEEQKLMSMLSQVKQGSQRPFPKGVSNIVAEMGAKYVPLNEIIGQGNWDLLNQYHKSGALKREPFPLMEALDPYQNEELADWLFKQGYRDETMDQYIVYYIEMENIDKVQELLTNPKILKNLKDKKVGVNVINALADAGLNEWVDYLVEQEGFVRPIREEITEEMLQAQQMSRAADFFRNRSNELEQQRSPRRNIFRRLFGRFGRR